MGMFRIISDRRDLISDGLARNGKSRGLVEDQDASRHQTTDFDNLPPLGSANTIRLPPFNAMQVQQVC